MPMDHIRIAPCKGIQDSLGFWILTMDSGLEELDFGFFVCGTCILDSNGQWDSGFLQLCSGFRSPGFWITQFLNLPDSGFHTQTEYRIYSINRPGRLLNFQTLRVGAYSRWALIRGWALIKFSSFSASKVCLFCNKTINANNKTRRSNKARFL